MAASICWLQLRVVKVLPPASSAGAVQRSHLLPIWLLVGSGLAAAGYIRALSLARKSLANVVTIPGIASVLNPASATVENFLLVGSDSRANIDPSSPDYGAIGSAADVEGSRSDTIMVLRRDLATNDPALLSIPRDLWVAIASGGKDRINAAYGEGPAVLIQTVQDALGLPIHHYVEIDFAGFKQLVDAIGGVELCLPYPARDTRTGLNVPAGGCTVYTGVQALAFARSRFLEQLVDGVWTLDGTADLGRMNRQQQFLKAALRGALAKVKTNPLVARDLLKAASSAVRVDNDLDLLAAAWSLRGLGATEPSSWSLPVSGATIDGKAVLELSGGAAEILAYFAGMGPTPGLRRPSGPWNVVVATT
jgi:LCP family protein required for cell wall assembly